MLNERIKELRTAMGITQVEFAKCMNVTKQCVSNWENDNIQPSVEMLIKIARFFSVSCDYLLGLDQREMLDVSGLSAKHIAHLKLIIKDISEKA